MKTMTSEKMEVLVAVPSLDSTAGGFVLAARQQDSKTVGQQDSMTARQRYSDTARQQDCKVARQHAR